MSFAIIRLGKDSVEDIKGLDAQHESPVNPIRFTVRCTQVPQGLAAGDYAFICFGSDNDKGIPTDWNRGVRALGTVQSKTGGPGRNDPWEVGVEVKVVLPESVAKKNLLAKAPTAYYWCSDIPVLGIEAFSNQTVQLVKDAEPNQNVAALVYGLSSIYPAFRTDTMMAYPELAPLFQYVPPEPSIEVTASEGSSQIDQGDWLKSLATKFIDEASAANLQTHAGSVNRFIASLLAKQFLIATGLAGSGKTKLAQSFARWISPDPGWIDAGDLSKGKLPGAQYALVPVGADWTGNETIVGYPDGLQEANYVTKPALELIRHALEPANAKVPHFLILDEMNLSHVERYFADLLSAVESGEEIPLYEGSERKAGGVEVPRKLRLPQNLFIIGTVNVDETTYMFSPKVLDRANVIEFCIEPDEMASFLAAPKAPRLEELDGRGAAFGKDFVEAAADKTREVPAFVKADYEKEMMLFFNLLREHNAEFGYRTGYEAARFVHFYKLLGGYSDDDNDWFKGAMDAVIVQKFLPKLHGSRSKLEGLLWALVWACGPERVEREGKDFAAQISEAGNAEDEVKYGPEVVWNILKSKNADEPTKAAQYPLSFDKVMRMWRKLVRDQFVSFAEA